MNYCGEIKVGDLFIWEPKIVQARTEVIVVRIEERSNDDRIIWCRDSTKPMHLYFNKTVWNDESRFREAVVPSLLRFAPSPLLDWETMNPHANFEGPWPAKTHAAMQKLFPNAKLLKGNRNAY